MAKKTYLEGINFDFTDEDDPKGIGPHIAYTTPAVGGCAIGTITNNQAYLLKSLEVTNKDTTEVVTSGGSTDKSKTQEIDKSNTKKTEINEENTTLDEKEVLKDVQAQLAVIKQERDELKKSLKIQEIEKSLTTYKFTEATQKALADVMVGIEDTKPIVDAFDEIISTTEEVAKAKGTETKEENPLTKMLDEEAGDAGDPDAANVDKSLVDQINEASKLV